MQNEKEKEKEKDTYRVYYVRKSESESGRAGERDSERSREQSTK
jgi:hypothetical protein